MWRRALATLAAVAVLAPSAIGATAVAAGADTNASACLSATVGTGAPVRPSLDGNPDHIEAWLAAYNDWKTKYGTAMDRDYSAAAGIGAEDYYRAGYFGQGVDVALIDSGVNTSLPGVDKGNIVQGPDFSFESQAPYGPNANPALAHTDTFGHGTHLASIIAGRDSNVTDPKSFRFGFFANTGEFMGVAPLSRVVSLKVADANGANDVTQVMAAIDWTVRHAHDPGLNIRVLNLAYGLVASDQTTDDALSYAIEQAWDAGIVVVTAAGNAGRATQSFDPGLTSPAYTRDVLAVGALDATGTGAAFSSGSSSGNTRLPDVSVPGASLVGIHNPGSTEDAEIIDRCVATGSASPVLGPLFQGEGRFLKGSGTSQASALAAGAVALMLSRNPELTNDGIKQVLRQTAAPVPGAVRRMTGEGEVDLAAAYARIPSIRRPTQGNRAVTGGGTIEQARGTIPTDDPKNPVANDLVGPGGVLSGNVDWMGNPINTDPKSRTSIEALENVDINHLPYCLHPGDYVAQKGYTADYAKAGYRNPCAGPQDPATPMPAIMGTAGRVVNGTLERDETWNGAIVTGFGWGGQQAPPGVAPDKTLAPWNTAQWKAPAWIGPAGYVGISWQKHSWTGHSWKTDDWSKIAWKSDGFLKLAWKDDSWSKVAWKGVDWS